jgi:hypothetical protein
MARLVGAAVAAAAALASVAAVAALPAVLAAVAAALSTIFSRAAFVTLLALVYLFFIVAIVVGFFRYKDRWSDPGSNWLKNFVLELILIAFAAWFAYWLMTHTHLREQAQKVQQAQTRQGNGQQRPGHVPATPARTAHFEWPIVYGIGGLVLLGGVWIYVRSRRRLPPLFGERGLEADMVAAIETTIDDLRSEKDARRAVIAAYALMEHTLARHGLARHRSEAPLEYLATILRGLRVRESAVVTLTRLFEYANFSRHPIDDEMKEEAIEALIAIRDDLQSQETIAA